MFSLLKLYRRHQLYYGYWPKATTVPFCLNLNREDTCILGICCAWNLVGGLWEKRWPTSSLVPVCADSRSWQDSTKRPGTRLTNSTGTFWEEVCGYSMLTQEWWCAEIPTNPSYAVELTGNSLSCFLCVASLSSWREPAAGSGLWWALWELNSKTTQN